MFCTRDDVPNNWAGAGGVHRSTVRRRSDRPEKCGDLSRGSGFSRDQRGVQRCRLGEYAGGWERVSMAEDTLFRIGGDDLVGHVAAIMIVGGEILQRKALPSVSEEGEFRAGVLVLRCPSRFPKKSVCIDCLCRVRRQLSWLTVL